MRRPGAQRRSAQGFTLIELMVGVAVAGVLAMVAIPSFGEMAARMRLEGAMSSLNSDLQYARSEALRRRSLVTLTVGADGGSYAITTPGALLPVVLKNVTLTGGLGLNGGVSVVFDPMRTFANAAADLTASASGTGATLRASINTVGRVQVCSPSGSFKGYTSC